MSARPYCSAPASPLSETATPARTAGLRKPGALGFAAVLALALSAPFAVRAAVVRVAFIDPFSGPFGILGQSGLDTVRMAEERYQQGKDKDKNDNTLEFTEFDNKLNAQESLGQLTAASDRGYRYIIQGVGSGATAALVDAIGKFNERNPGKEMLLLDWTAGDPDLTNARCSFWHYRFDANSDMKLEAMTRVLARDTAVRKVYLVNQNSPTGQQTQRASIDFLKRKRPDVAIVGDDLVQTGMVKDFSAYAAKIKASGADTVVSGNTGADLALLIKAAREAGIDAGIYTLYGQAAGTPTAMGSSGADRVRIVSSVHANIENGAAREMVDEMRRKYREDFVALSPTLIVGMLHQAFRQARSTDPTRVAFALEGLKFNGMTGEVEMRRTDHQIQLPLYLSIWSKVDGNAVRFDQEGTGYGWRTVEKSPAPANTLPTTCAMRRPEAR